MGILIAGRHAVSNKHKTLTFVCMGRRFILNEVFSTRTFADDNYHRGFLIIGLRISQW
jgi:hypothetical protein